MLSGLGLWKFLFGYVIMGVDILCGFVYLFKCLSVCLILESRNFCFVIMVLVLYLFRLFLRVCKMLCWLFFSKVFNVFNWFLCYFKDWVFFVLKLLLSLWIMLMKYMLVFIVWREGLFGIRRFW